MASVGTACLQPVDADTRFQLASMAKFITATAVGTLVDRGVVAWDRPVREFALDLALAAPYVTQNVTLRDFFAHRYRLAGLRRRPSDQAWLLR